MWMFKCYFLGNLNYMQINYTMISFNFYLILIAHSIWISDVFCDQSSKDNNSLLIIIRSQPNEYHDRVAMEKKINLDAQIKEHNLNVKVVLLHKEWPVESAWALLPLMPDIARKYSGDFSWTMFVEEGTNIDLSRLTKEVLPMFDSKQKIYFGRCLTDQDITIIHHFARIKNFHYPDFHAGWVMSNTLVDKLANDWNLEKHSTDFQIDVQHEIAMVLDKKYKIKMTCSKKFCGASDNQKCITSINYEIPNCGNKIDLNDILIAVKTTKMFHETRVNVVKRTWGQYAKNIIYYSNVSDATVPSIDCGVPNTLRGHCGKMQAIINDAYHKENLKKFSWLVIADDDSIIGLSQMVKLLNCYKSNIPVVLGERYGFALNSGYGYSYITGGGSMVMSRGAIQAWVEQHCDCPSIDTPDDMYLGQCFSFAVGIPVTHSPRFHQARPVDYSLGYISNLKPVSFHKHWEIDPFKVYKTYFADDDNTNFSLSKNNKLHKPETLSGFEKASLNKNEL